ncbi:hypothetical protein HJ526_15805 [Donghicola sp. C2-DW-16]|uniref:STAS domain-containing protein n=1 Tax=Donghicola mangrovi TaxID=2729614 RepID=A0ABX2PIC4_9RHOB|nr:hypothetical protein [Donghicola mangrovi]NVO28895.1 hypothetical protein [Donghicola mangrovi]
MTLSLHCEGFQDIVPEAQTLSASLKSGTVDSVELPTGFPSPVGLLQFALSIRASAEAQGRAVTITCPDPEVHKVAQECGLSGVLAPLTGGDHVQ